MDDELVLLTSYFNLVGGRRQETADTFRVESDVPSATSEDGKAAVYIVTESSAGGPMGMRARRRAADVVAWEYASNSDTAPPQRLRAALRAADEALTGEFEGHVTVGLSVMAVEGNTVYLGQVAPSQVYVLHEGSLHSMPASVEGSSPFARALGSSAGPRISVGRDEIGPDDVVAICSSWFRRGADTDELRDCFSAPDSDEIAEELLELAKQHDVQDATAIVIEAVPTSVLEAEQQTNAAPTFMEQVDSAVQALTHVGRMLWAEFRVSTSHDAVSGNGRHAEDDYETVPEPSSSFRASSTVVDRPTSAPASESFSLDGITTEHPVVSPTTDEPRERPQSAREPRVEAPPRETGRREQATEEVPIVEDTSGVHDREYEDHGHDRYAAGSHPVLPDTLPEPEPEPISEMEQVNTRIRNDPDLGDVMPPVQAFPEASTEPERIYATSKDIQAVNKRRPRRFGGLEDGPPVVRPSVSAVDLDRPPGRHAPPWVVWFAIAAVMALVGSSAVVYYLNHRHPVRAVNPYPNMVRRDLALAAGATTAPAQDRYLGKAQRDLGYARLNGASAKTVSTLSQRIQATSDTLRRITRESAPGVVGNFSGVAGANPTEIATSPGFVYVLDAGRKSVFALKSNSAANPTTILQPGEIDNGLTVGTPVHITTDGTTVLMLDDRSILVRDAQGTKTATSLTGGAQNERIVALSTNDPDVYTLDAANSQVWRYPVGVSGYDPSPNAYFTPSSPHMPDAVSLAFDGTDLYILRSSGAVLKYDMQANVQRFDPGSTLRTPLQKPVALYTDRNLPYVWIADPTNRRIVQLDKSGKFSRTYMSSSSNMPFDQIRSMSVGPAGNTLYVLCGFRVLSFPIVR